MRKPARSLSWRVVISVMLILFLAFYLSRSPWQKLSKVERLKEIKDEVSKLEGENASLRKRLEEVSKDAFVEKEAREKLGMAKTGEKVVIIPQEENKTRVLGEETKAPELAVWKQWVALFGVVE